MKQKLFTCLLGIITSFACVYPGSMVYNFRVAQITKNPAEEKKNTTPYTAIGLLFGVFGKRGDIIYQNFAGGFGSLIYNFQPYYFRADFAVAHIHEKITGIRHFSTTQADDVVFTCGRNYILNTKNIISVSGLFGVPTHTNTELQHTSFGYSQIGMGAQVDGIHAFSKTSFFSYGARYLYFVPGTARDNREQTYSLSIGNIVDLLVAYKTFWADHGIEVGYTLKCEFGAHITPHVQEIIELANYTRSNVYAVYRYSFMIHDHPNKIFVCFSSSFDHGHGEFSYKYLFTVWGSWGVSF